MALNCKQYLRARVFHWIVGVSLAGLLNGQVVSVTVGPVNVTLSPTQTQQFAAAVTGTGNTGVSWLIIPAIGTISSGGLYTAPATVTNPQSIKVIATSLADATKTATAIIALTVPVSTPDSTPPTISIITPSNGTRVSGNVSVSATASDNVGVTGVRFFADGAAVGAEIAAAPYTVNWNSSSVSDGTHVISAVARDAAGNSTTAAISVTVSNAPAPVVSITLGPANASLAASQTQQFTATVGGSSNTGVSWSVSPQVGTISSGGLYTAPATISSVQNVTVTAASLADPTKTATAAVTLTPIVSITLGPANASLAASQTQQFTATVSGSSNTGVSWSISPQVGTISSGGLYTAPATITSAQNVTVTASSLADSTKTATAAVALTPVVSITLGPANASLAASQTQQFTATVSGSSNTGASWSISPQVGTISSGGLYTAPATITSAQNVTVTARSLADPTKTATAAVALTPVVSITLGPANASLGASQTQQFTATVSGSSNTGASWSISPQVGTISSGGLYTAPATISSGQNVTVTASSLADPTKTAAAVVTLTTAITLYLGPANANLIASQTQQFTVKVVGSNTGVSWSISPQLGTISSGGLYTAPATISTAQNVTVTATSLADATKTATALVALTSSGSPSVVSITLGPANASVSASQTQQFTATVTGSSNTGVSWSISPQLGTISTSGLYTSPGQSSFTAQSVITVTATSLADPTKTATATVTVTPVVSITLGPGATSLTASQTQQFTATVAGTSNTGVSWSINPLLGTISSGGLYTAPSTITSAQSVMLTATSLADATKTAVAVIALTLSPPPLTISITAPGNGSTVSGTVGISATAGGSVTGVQFYADSVPVGTQLTAPPYTVNWNSLLVPDGTHTLSAIAQDAGGNQTTATISVSVGNTPTVSRVTLPIEVMGAAGTTRTVQVDLASAPAGTLRLWLQIHGLKYQTEASVQVNSGAWLPINDTTVTLLGNAAGYGGIGGGFSTLKLTMNLPTGAVVAGTNTIRFRFNGTDGNTSGFRVLGVNFVAPDGTAIVNSSNFIQDDPTTWQPPSSQPSDISAGKQLWFTASLTTPGGPILATCGMCHAQDGRDLKYFNYSNYSIRARSMFHGLTAQQGDQIASYIRSLNVSAPTNSRPWNPPYQPGPGLDSRPVTEWAAGAGVDAVLDNDNDMNRYLMPGGDTSNWAPIGNVNVREIPITMQLPDWNRWLPQIHPLDAWGADFANSRAATDYPVVRSMLRYQDPLAYQNARGAMGAWDIQLTILLQPKQLDASVVWTPAYSSKIYSSALWKLVKFWEIMQEFGLEGLNQAAFGPQGEPRGWYSSAIFNVSPNLLHIPFNSSGIDNGLASTAYYVSQVWYHLQLILNNSNRQQSGSSPIDFPYVYGFIKDLSHLTVQPQANLMFFWITKALQGSQSGLGPEFGSGGWAPNTNGAVFLVDTNWSSIYSQMPASTRALASEAYLRHWFGKVSSFTPQQWYQGGWADPTVNPTPGASAQLAFGDTVWYMLPQFQYIGVSPTLITQIADWAKTVWPGANWNAIKTAICAPNGAGFTVCSTEKISSTALN